MIRSIGVGLVLALLGGAGDLGAQCWDCGTTYWPGNDCWMETCYWTSGAGSANCTQYGQCGDIDSCDTNGHGCVGDVLHALLDGRADLGMDVAGVTALLDASEPDSRFRVSPPAPDGRTFVRLACNGIVVWATYSVASAREARARTRRLVL